MPQMWEKGRLYLVVQDTGFRGKERFIASGLSFNPSDLQILSGSVSIRLLKQGCSTEWG
jgi:hypothetical protein